KARAEAVKALGRAEGMRLVLQARLLLPNDPEQALLLAVEGARRHRSAQTDAALLAILDAHREGRALHTDFEARTVRFSRDGRRVLTTNGRGMTPVHLWDPATGKRLFHLSTPQAGWSAAFSPDGKLLLTSSLAGGARLGDGETGKALHTLTGDGWAIDEDSFSPDSRLVGLSDGGKTASVWDTQTGKKRLTLPGHTAAVRQVRFSPDGAHILTA